MNNYSVFWEIECIKNLESNCLLNFQKVFTTYASRLLDRIDVWGSVYTPHDVNHCLNIYKCISKVILKNPTSYNVDFGLTSRELFILDLAVLFHDIGMSDVINPERKNHSKAAAEYIEKEYEDNRSDLKQSGLTPLEKKALKAIVKAHSDIKGDPDINPSKNGLDADDLQETYEDISSKPIRVKLLAGILRLADELDVTNERLGSSLVEIQLKEMEETIKNQQGDDKSKEIYAGYLESKKHWDKLHLFEMISLDLESGIINLKVDDEHVTHQIERGDTERSIANDISEVILKIEKELKAINEKCFSKTDVRGFIYISHIQAVTKNKSLHDEIQKEQSIVDLPKLEVDKKNIEEEIVEYETNDKIQLPPIIDNELAKKICEEVKERKLLEFGHYRLNDVYCARDWLNVMELVETREISKRIVSAIVKHINSRNMDNIVVLGMDMVGALLAARVSFALQKPMSYFVSIKNQQYNSQQDIDFEIKENEKVVIITESVVTFKTIDDAVNKYGLNDKIDSIYTVFYRKTEMEGCGKVYLDKIYSVNNDFPIEVVKKDKCIYNRCLATNRH